MSSPKAQLSIIEDQLIAETPLQQLRSLYDQSQQLETTVLWRAIQRIASQNPELTEQIRSDYLNTVKEFSASTQTVAARASQYLQEVSAQSRQLTADFLKSPHGRSHLPGQIPLGIPQDRLLPVFPSSPHITLAAYTCVLESLGMIAPEDFDIPDGSFPDGGMTPQGCGSGRAQQQSPELITFFLDAQSSDIINTCEFMIRTGAHLNSNRILNDPTLQIAEHDTLFFETGASVGLDGTWALGNSEPITQGIPHRSKITIKMEIVFSLWDVTRNNRTPVLLGSDNLTFDEEILNPLGLAHYFRSKSANLKVGTVLRRNRTLALTIDLKLALVLTGNARFTLNQPFSSFHLHPFYFSRQECKYTFVKIRGPWEIELEGMVG